MSAWALAVKRVVEGVRAAEAKETRSRLFTSSKVAGDTETSGEMETT